MHDDTFRRRASQGKFEACAANQLTNTHTSPNTPTITSADSSGVPMSICFRVGVANAFARHQHDYKHDELAVGSDLKFFG